MVTTSRGVKKSKNRTEGSSTKEGIKNKQLLRSRKDQKERKKTKRNNMIHDTNINKKAKSTTSPTSSIQTNFNSSHLLKVQTEQGFNTPTQLLHNVKLPQKPTMHKTN